MKNSKRIVLAVALAVLGSGAVMTASAQAAPGSAPGAHGPHHGGFDHFRRGPGGQLVGTLLRAIHQVEKNPQTTSAIKTDIASAEPTIQGYLKTARQAARSSEQGLRTQIAADVAAGNFAAAAAAEASAASARVNADGALAQQIYAALGTGTAAGQAVLTQIATDQANAAKRRAAWQANHPHHQPPVG